MKTAPDAFTTTASGALNLASDSGPPSPLPPATVPAPPYVDTVPSALSDRMTWLPVSATNTALPGSADAAVGGTHAMRFGDDSAAAVPAPPSPKNPATPVPATVTRVPLVYA